MASINGKRYSMKHYPRFGQIALKRGFVTEEQLHEVLTEQMTNSPYNRLRPHRLIGEIFFEKSWMNQVQIKIVLNELYIKEHIIW
jgi:hypothetical protein